MKKARIRRIKQRNNKKMSKTKNKRKKTKQKFS